ncbi:MAG TPA: hypothetical protein VE870_04650 [Bacteroidales bacterium]|nr:hypothetical protein [Bacteroidales bacterium]
MLRTILTFFLVIPFILQASGQDTVCYFAADYKPVPEMSQAKFMKRIKRKAHGKYVIKSFIREEKIWKAQPKKRVIHKEDGLQLVKISDRLLTPKKIYRYYEEKSPGIYTFEEFIRKKLYRKGSATSLVPLILQDTVTEYYQSGHVKSITIYRNNQLIGNQNWLRDGSPYISDIYYAADKIPEYEKGFAFFRSYILGNLEKSEIDFSQVDDQVVLGWVITESGELEGIRVVSGKFRNLNRIMVKLVSSLPGKWEPATIDGRKVRYYMEIPFNFGQSTPKFDYLQLNNAGQLTWD